MNWKLLVVAVAFAASIFVSAILSLKTYNTDFPMYYSAASTILDPEASPEDVYDADAQKQYAIPERKEVETPYVYSLLVAFLFTPLAWMPYYTAKAVMIFLNIMSYLFAVAIILKLGNVSDRWIAFGVAISVLWLPFIHTLLFGQVNALITVLVALAVLAVTRGSPYLCGVFIAFAALFKFFPLAIALVLGLRDRRIVIGFAVVFGATFLIPGATKWIATILNFLNEDRGSLTYIWVRAVSAVSPVLFFMYPVIIGSVTAFLAAMAKDDDYPLLTAFAITAVFLAMPRLAYYHLTVLVLTYGYLFSMKEYRNWLFTGFLLLSAVILGFPRRGPVLISPPIYIALFFLWVVIGILISTRSYSRIPAGGA
jgi:hypothetical protein